MLLRRHREARKAHQTTSDHVADAETAVVSLDDMKGPDLKAALKDLGLPVSGKVDELRDRLRDARVAPDAVPGEGDPNEGADGRVDHVADAETAVGDHDETDPDDPADHDPEQPDPEPEGDKGDGEA